MDLSVKHLRDLFGGNIPVAQVLQSVASGMADCGVNVVIDPNTPMPYAIPEEKKIVLPAHVRSERALLVVSWHVDHEAGHIIYSPSYRPTIMSWLDDSKMLDVCKDRGYPAKLIDIDGTIVKSALPDSILHAAKFFHNMCEDARIEQLMVSRWPGVKKHFIGGPIAAACDHLVEDTLKMAEEKKEVEGLKETPISPFFVAMSHAHGLMGGRHGQEDTDYVRELMPKHVDWVLDITEDEFANVNIHAITFEEIAEKVDTVVSKLLDKLLPEHQEQPQQNGPGQGEQEGEEGEQGQKSGGKGKSGGGPQPPDPFKDKIDPDNDPKGETREVEYEDDEDDGEGSGEDAGNGEDESEDGDEQGGSGGSGSDSEDESGGDESSGGGSDGDEESDDSGDESGDNSSSSSDDDDDSDGSSGDGGTSASDDDGESDGDSDDGSEEDGLSGDTDSDEDDDDETEGAADGDECEGEVGSDEDDAETGEINTKALPKQVEEWAKEAHVDLSELIRASGETGADPGGAGGGDPTGNTSGAPTSMNHATDTEGMPDAYLEKLAPGARVVVIQDNDLGLLFDDKDQTFMAYDTFIRGLMPQNLGPAARKLLGRFKGAPGKAWAGSRINPKMLQPIISGNAYGRRLYLRRNEPTQSRKGVCVMVAIDCSGSMCESVSGLNLKNGRNSKFSVSHAAARGIARLLQTVNVPFGVMGFLATSMKYRAGHSYGASRSCDIVNFLFKDFHEPWTACEQRMLAMNPNTSVTYKGTHISPHTNSDGESLLWGATQIITREESRKIMIVISDGLPYAGDTQLQSGFLKWAVRRIETAGIKIGGLGLGDDGVRHYYRLYELIQSFPPGMGTDFMAPLYIQEKILSLIDRLTMEKD